MAIRISFSSFLLCSPSCLSLLKQQRNEFDLRVERFPFPTRPRVSFLMRERCHAMIELIESQQAEQRAIEVRPSEQKSRNFSLVPASPVVNERTLSWQNVQPVLLTFTWLPIQFSNYVFRQFFGFGVSLCSCCL